MKAISKSRSKWQDPALLWRRFLWFPIILSATLLILPQLAFISMSFHRDLGMGQVSEFFTLENYTKLLTDPHYLDAMWRTTYLSIAATLLSIMTAFPTAYWIARTGGWTATVVLSLVLASSLITVVIKLMGLNIILGPSGILNEGLIAIGVVRDPLKFLNNEFGVLIGLVQYTLPILVLMSFSLVQTIPENLEEAAHIHGATNAATFFQVIVPLAKIGILGGSLISFNMCMGAFTSPLILGGGRVLTVPVLIQQKIISDSEYGTGAALAILLVVFVFAINLIAATYIGQESRQQSNLRR